MKILSIDIDYAYSPSIAQYDDFVEGSRISYQDQQKIFELNNLPGPEANLNKIALLKEVVRLKTESTTPTVICDRHDHILDFLPDDRLFEVYNFDHHHDIYYPGWHDLYKLDEGNWVYHCSQKPIIKYVWMRNKDSEDLEDPPALSFEYVEVLDPVIDDMPQFDLLFGCSSMHWTGKSGRRHLFEVLGANS